MNLLAYVFTEYTEDQKHAFLKETKSNKATEYLK